MATYPGGVFSPAAKANGNVIQASFFNDPDAEIVAVENALLNGIAHAVTVSTGGLTISTGGLRVSGPSTLAAIEGAASTLASLQVTGLSTFTGAVTFSGGINVSTFPDPMTLSSGAVVSTGVIRQNSLPAWNVYHSTFVAMGSGSTQGASFDTQDFVRGNIGHSTGANSSRVTVNSTGLYHVSARSVIHSGTNPFNRGSIVLNDVTTVLQTIMPTIGLGGGSSQTTVQVSGLVRMASTGYLTFQLTSESAASTHGSSSPFQATRFEGYFVG